MGARVVQCKFTPPKAPKLLFAGLHWSAGSTREDGARILPALDSLVPCSFASSDNKPFS